MLHRQERGNKRRNRSSVSASAGPAAGCLTQLHVRVVLWDDQGPAEKVLAALEVDEAAAHVADGVAVAKAAAAGEEAVRAQRALVEADGQRLLRTSRWREGEMVGCRESTRAVVDEV